MRIICSAGAPLIAISADGSQRIRAQNFYPFLNLHGHTCPPPFIDVECTVQNIQVKAAKHPQPGDQLVQEASDSTKFVEGASGRDSGIVHTITTLLSMTLMNQDLY